MKHPWVIRFTFLVSIVLGRWLPHPPNWTPVGGVAITGSKSLGTLQTLMVILTGIWLSDLWINNIMYPSHQFIWLTNGWAYLSLAYTGMVLISRYVSTRVPSAIMSWFLRSTLASLVFYVISNFGVWMASDLYPSTIGGLLACYAMAIPFLASAWMADMCFSGILECITRPAFMRKCVFPFYGPNELANKSPKKSAKKSI